MRLCAHWRGVTWEKVGIISWAAEIWQQPWVRNSLQVTTSTQLYETYGLQSYIYHVLGFQILSVLRASKGNVHFRWEVCRNAKTSSLILEWGTTDTSHPWETPYPLLANLSFDDTHWLDLKSVVCVLLTTCSLNQVFSIFAVDQKNNPRGRRNRGRSGSSKTVTFYKVQNHRTWLEKIALPEDEAEIRPLQ